MISALETIETLLPELSSAEKARLLQWVMHDIGYAVPGIEAIPGVSGGEPCIIRTRIPVWVFCNKHGSKASVMPDCYSVTQRYTRKI